MRDNENQIEPRWFLRPFFDSNGRPLLLNITIALLIITTGWSAFAIVQQDEEAPRYRFGKYIETLGPGFHIKIPFLESIVSTKITKIRHSQFGYRVEDDGSHTTIMAEAEMLTQDEKLVDLDGVLQYKVADAYKWQTKVENPDLVLNLLIQSAMRQVMGKTPFELVITTDRNRIQAEALALMEALTNKLDFGVQLISFNLQGVHPPKPVQDAYDDVVRAGEDREKSIENANKYQNDILPKAEGYAAKILNDAKGKAAERVALAEGDVAKFLAIAKEYKRAPEVTRQRLIYEAQQVIFPGKKIVIDHDTTGLLKLYNLNQTKLPGGDK